MKKTKPYGHIKKAERLELSILLKKKYSLRSIARVLQRSVSSLSEEVRLRSVNGVYDPLKAQHKAYVARKYAKWQGMKVAGNDELREHVETKLTQDWSPEQIAGRIKEQETYLPYVSYGGIYKYIYSVYGRPFEQCLRYKGHKKRRAKRGKVTSLPNRIFINKRPKAINERKRFGDWEGDFIVSGKQGKGILLVLHERKARYTLIKKLMDRDSQTVNTAIQEATRGLLSMNSLTLDNDISFQKHEELSCLMGIPVYFCHPYHSWEKGSVENTNKLIRQYIPKGSDISSYSDACIKNIETKLNSRPRKCLRYQTPLEVMMNHNQFQSFQEYANLLPLKKAEVFDLRG
jgi:transposase, IS30 family